MKKSKLLTLLVLVLAVCTVVGMMAFSASAAEADHPHTADTTHCACGGFGAVEGSGHTECAEETWTAWTNGMTSPTAGNYYLAEDVTITTAITLSGDFKLCLNGYTLTCNGSRLFTHVVNGYRALDICDCSQGKTGKITSNYVANQGGIIYFGRGRINMFSGTLEQTAASSTANGGVIRMGYGSDKNNMTGAFWMYGGKITGGVGTNGGNIYAGNSSNITINLLGGTVTEGSAKLGGNIYITNGTLNLKGATISNGKCDVTGGAGGNVACYSNSTSPVMNMSDGWVYGGSASGYGDNVQVQGSTATFNMTGGYIGLGNQTVTDSGHNLNMINSTFNMTGGTIKGLVRATCTGSNTCTITVNQAARITGAQENLLLANNNVILNVGSEEHDLGENGSVGITLDSAYTNATFANATADPAGLVYSDNEYSKVTYADGKLALSANTMQVGYSQVSIAPAAGTPLGGYGYSAERLSTGNDETYGLTATVIAITDSEGETVLLITADLVGIPETVADAARAAIKEATNVSVSHIMIAATHTHAAPDMSIIGNDAIEMYKNELYTNLANAAVAALADRAPATAAKATVDLADMNCVRHYTDGNGNYYGYQYWANQAGATQSAADADCAMQLLKFDRGADKAPVVVANWQVHPNVLGNVDYASADLVGAFRTAVNAATGWNVAYFSGAGGNLIADYDTTEAQVHVAMGQAMAAAATAEDVAFVNAGLSQIETKQTKYAANLKTVSEEEYNAACAFLTGEDTGWNAALAAGFNSAYEAKTIKRVFEMNSTTKSIELNAISLGQVAFVAAPYEMFDVDGQTIKAADSHEMVIIMSQANGSVGYITADLSANTYVNGVYEQDMSIFADGTGAALAAQYVEMLADTVSDDYCTCGGKCSGRQGHTCADVSWQAFPANGRMPTSGNYYLDGDITISYTAGLCAIDGSLAIDLNGHTLTLNSTGNGRAFTIGSGETLSICDSTGNGQIILTGTAAQAGGMIFNVGGTANIFGGTIDASGLSSTAEGVIIRNASNGTCNIYNATLIGGTTTGNGGAISNGATLNVYTDVVIKNGSAAQGGNIYSTTKAIKIWGNVTGGTATAKGGNIYSAYSTYVYGKIDNGSAPEGGNIYQSQYTLFLFGAEIANAKQGGGVYIKTGAKVTIGGNTVTAMNKMDESSFVNLYLPTGTLIGLGTANEPLLATANVGITQENEAEPIASTETTNLAQGVEYSDVFYKQGAECGVVEIDGKLYFQDYVAYAFYAQDDTYKSQGYYSIEDAMAHTDVIYVQLCADRNEDLNVSSDLYLDLAGFSINATVNVAEGATLYGLDSATNDFDIADGYGKIAAINGNYAMLHGKKLTTQTNRYVTIVEESGISFHRYYAAVTAISLDPSNDALGYKATFRGDEMVRAAVESFGYNMWVNESKVITKLQNGGFADGQILTLRLKNILAAGGGEMQIHAQAVVKFRHIADHAVGSTQSTTMKSVLQAVNAAWADYSDAQKQAVEALCAKYEITKNWELSNIIAA